MKRNICLFKSFLTCFLLLFVVNGKADTQGGFAVRGDAALDSIDVFLLTCQPHDEIYSLYGHTSLRLVDRATGMDYAINFGVFDSTSKNFALRFIFGLTDYMMAMYGFDRFLAEYRYYGSGVYQQHINMSREEKREFLNALYEASLPENVVYRYNFFYNNCTSKARDIVLGAMSGEVCYEPTSLQRGKRSFRELIHLKNSDHRWARLGNDLLLGVGADANTSHEDRQFLPEVLMNDFDSASIKGADGTVRPLVDESKWVLAPGTPYHPDNAFECQMSPRMMAILFFCAILSLCIAQLLLLRKVSLWVDYCVMLLYGTLGIILGAMIFSKHPTVSLNLQILIFNPLYLVFMFPKLHFRWRWHIVAGCCVVFFLGNAIQSYAEGMNIVALALLLYAAYGLLTQYYDYRLCKK